ncbi:uncharacterized protein GIQ15_00425 [Arthroderma uncinatum]|uniref:uncharacterized protein n=1 Tax=Arthroderma uncinatum TaxID=74035 RepID=UPI00144A98B4|nr:uncharacterized protein GIQ15_00425 [Arthroderma uncinatum]KAF3490908.1 hypothetical protein GIQ15_00425 [Arthroderma uncinatum]
MRFFITFLSALLVLFAPLNVFAAEETVYSTSTSTQTVTMTIIHSVSSPTATAMPTYGSNSTAPYPSSMMTKTWGTGTGGMPTHTGNPAPQPTINGAAGLPVSFSTALMAGSVALLLGAAL